MKRIAIQFLLFLSIVLSIFNCKNNDKTIIHKSTDGSDKEYNNWFTQDSNYQKPEYKERFLREYNQALNQKDYKKSTEILRSVSNYVMNYSSFYDEYYIKEVEKYLVKHESLLSKEDIFTFYFDIGAYYKMDKQAEKSLNHFKKIAELEANNYYTNIQKGNTHFFISKVYSLAGDYDNALLENEKAVECFNKTDDREGQAMIFQSKANLLRETGNIDEAIEAIDKAINIRKEENEVFLVNSLIEKYKLLKDSPEKASIELDTVNEYIKKGGSINSLQLYLYNEAVFLENFDKNNIQAVDTIFPKLVKYGKLQSSKFFDDKIEVHTARYQLLTSSKILNKDKLLPILKEYRENNDSYLTTYILKILKTEAILNRDLGKALLYDNELDSIAKKVQEKDIQFKVKTFEKKIDTEKKEKIIAQQSNELSRSYILLFGLMALLLSGLLGAWIISLRKKKKQAVEEQLKQEQFTFQLLQNTEEERNRIANELHDSVNHELLTIKNNITNGKTIDANEIGNVIEEVRNISKNLHPAMLETVGLAASIENMCERVTEAGLFTSCEIDYQIKLSNNKELQLYRIIQEALNNTLKHGKANAAKVILTSQGNLLQLEIKDNGNGFDVDEQLNNPKSFGLRSIIQRAKSMLAKINIDSSEKGTIILIKIPV